VRSEHMFQNMVEYKLIASLPWKQNDPREYTLTPLGRDRREIVNVAENLQYRQIVTFRSAADQDAAKAAGLSNAASGQSPHNCTAGDGAPAARAFDFAVFGPDGSYITRGQDARYEQCGKIAVAIGEAQDLPITWGGSWTPETDGCQPDYDHVQMRDWKMT
jgi:hypothetical protein